MGVHWFSIFHSSHPNVWKEGHFLSLPWRRWVWLPLKRKQGGWLKRQKRKKNVSWQKRKWLPSVFFFNIEKTEVRKWQVHCVYMTTQKPAFAHIHTLATEPTIQDAICSSGAITIHTHSHRSMEQLSSAIWGSVAQGHFNVKTAGARDQTDLLISRPPLYLLSHSRQQEKEVWHDIVEG